MAKPGKTKVVKMVESDWISYEQPPTEKGAYRRKFTDDEIGWQYWNGDSWNIWTFSMEDAIEAGRTYFVSYLQEGWWKGLIEK